MIDATCGGFVCQHCFVWFEQWYMLGTVAAWAGGPMSTAAASRTVVTNRVDSLRNRLVFLPRNREYRSSHSRRASPGRVGRSPVPGHDRTFAHRHYAGDPCQVDH